MTRLIDMIVGNPAALLWIALAAFATGAVCGAGPAWWIQGLRVTAAKNERDKVQATFDGFVSTTKAQGEAAQKAADAKAKSDRVMKENSDRDYETTIARLDADIKRLRNARARTNYVPVAPAGSRSPDLACFDRPELERALRQFDDAVAGLIAEGDADAVGLNVAKRWAASIAPDSRANIHP